MKQKLGELDRRALIGKEICTPDGWIKIIGYQEAHRALILQLEDGSEWSVGLWKLVEVRDG